MECKGDGDTICGWCTRDNLLGISKGTGRLGIKRTRGDHLNYSIIKSARILRRVQETCCHSNSSEKASTNAGEKNSQIVKKIYGI